MNRKCEFTGERCDWMNRKCEFTGERCDWMNRKCEFTGERRKSDDTETGEEEKEEGCC